MDQVMVGDGTVTFVARAVASEAVCPGCGTASRRVHGNYQRRLADLAVAGQKTVINLLVSDPGRLRRPPWGTQIEGARALVTLEAIYLR
ncbi:transposase family protein, partial [Streptomyces sp. NPDC097981]|uniref:transposase family protein n=1 Tax=Streptomyces sp. NPDC097981 TaxID=3155428 RepID=UPI0033324394